MPWVVYVSDTDVPAMPIFSSHSRAEADDRAERVYVSAAKNRHFGIRVEVRWEDAGGVASTEDAAHGERPAARCTAGRSAPD